MDLENCVYLWKNPGNAFALSGLDKYGQFTADKVDKVNKGAPGGHLLILSQY